MSYCDGNPWKRRRNLYIPPLQASAVPGNILFVGSNQGFDPVAVPAHAAGDWIIAMTSRSDATPADLLPGFTSIGFITDTVGGAFNSHFQYIIDTLGTINSIANPTPGQELGVSVYSGVQSVGAVSAQSNGAAGTDLDTAALGGLSTNSIAVYMWQAPGVATAYLSDTRIFGDLTGPGYYLADNADIGAGDYASEVAIPLCPGDWASRTFSLVPLPL